MQLLSQRLAPKPGIGLKPLTGCLHCKLMDKKKSLGVIRKLLLSNVAANDFSICSIYSC